jgi:hypothetical protein
MRRTRRDGSNGRLRFVLLCGAALCAAGAACSRGGAKPDAGASPAADAGAEPAAAAAVSDDTLVEGTGVGALRIDEATMDDVVKAYRLSSPITRANESIIAMSTPQVPLYFWFVAPTDGQGAPRLYAVRHLLYDQIYKGTTSRGIGILDSLEAVKGAYGEPDASWVGTFETLHYYGQQGVIFTTNHPKDIRPEVYARARAALGKEPSEGPSSSIVVGITVVRPFTVTDPGTTQMDRQRVLTTRPETDLLRGFP